MPLIDPFHRQISYLRVSVTDHCNYRCSYCRDEYHKTSTSKSSVLTLEEIAKIVQLFSELGVHKVRLTGGEPLLRKNIIGLVAMLAQIDGIKDIPLSTNAHLLSGMVADLKATGVNRVNISLDSLNKDKFAEITRGGDLGRVIDGIESAIDAGMSPVKLNMVVMRGVNDDEIEAMLDFVISRGIDIRFIETMPIGTAGIGALDQHYSEEKILKRAQAHLPYQLTAKDAQKGDGPAKNFFIDGTHSSFGTISAVSNHFCQTCNRLRLTAKGRLILCLGHENSVSLRDMLRSGMDDDEIKQNIIQAITKKPQQHYFNSVVDNVSGRQMVEIGG